LQADRIVESGDLSVFRTEGHLITVFSIKLLGFSGESEPQWRTCVIRRNAQTEDWTTAELLTSSENVPLFELKDASDEDWNCVLQEQFSAIN
jgi:hypothetical protein